MEKRFSSKGRNPVLPPDICIPDGEAHVFHDKLYVYGSFDVSAKEYCSEEYHVASTSDMLTWEVGEKSLDGKEIPWPDDKKKKKYYVVDMGLKDPTPVYREILKGMHIPLGLMPKGIRPQNIDFGAFVPNKHLLFAPDCCEKNGKYYLYFCMSDYTEGVAVSENPQGSFRDPVRLPCGGIDPAVFVDDDGKVYYYWGQFRANGVRLNDDMTSFDESSVVERIVTEEEHGFHEGSSMRKRNGIYYYVYPCIFRKGRPTCLAYATSKSPLGPFTYRGIIIDNAKCDPESWNIHGSIEEFHGQWYVFYHRSSGNCRANRRLCVEKIYFNDNGTIDEVKMTSQGAGEPFALGEAIEGWRAAEVEGGAYIDGTDLVMKKGSRAVIRYCDFEKAPVRMEADFEGEGALTAAANGKPLDRAEQGPNEIVLTSSGDLRVHSVRFLSEEN